MNKYKCDVFYESANDLLYVLEQITKAAREKSKSDIVDQIVITRFMDGEDDRYDAMLYMFTVSPSH